MDGHVMPPPTPCILIRSCEASRLQRQLLARAYQQVCPEVRKSLHDSQASPAVPDRAQGSSTAAGMAAGA